MLEGEDLDLNYRIRAGGGRIWFTPDLRVTYRPRASVRTLAAQYFHYGRWRRVIVREHPETASFRDPAPPGAAALVTVGLLAWPGLAWIAAGGPAAAQWLTAGLAVPVIYLAGVTAVAVALARGVPATVRARIPLVLAAMHMAWGAGFPHQPARAAPQVRHACRATGRGHGKRGPGRRRNHGLRPAGPARRPPP